MTFEELQLRWFRERLADLALLDRVAFVDLGDAREVAVPVGGRRRGGFLALTTRREVRAALRQLRALPDGFPNVRAVYSDSREVCHNVRWGDPEPRVPAAAASDLEWAESERRLGEHYGYSDSAIATYIAEQYGALVS